MAAVVRALEDLGYGWAYRVVDGRYLGPAGRDKSESELSLSAIVEETPDPRGKFWVTTAQAKDRLRRVLSAGDRSGPSARRGPTEDGSLIWRKSARPRASLAKGGYETWVPAEFANTLTKLRRRLTTAPEHIIYQGGRLRTFTPMEWERLQGFPDGWTEGIPDSARYDALGNAMHVGMAEWLGRRLAAVHHALPQLSHV
jgi:DNA (cytosine-5)-methyltransferase 1